MGKKQNNEKWDVQKTEAEWKDQLSPEQFHVARQAGTERAFTGPNWDSKEAGTYHCICCDVPLFTSDTKYESGTGWPSFFQPISETAIAERSDDSLLMKRTEILCNNCGAHLGHVFPDGPQPRGTRYCMNGTALNLKSSNDVDA